MKKFLLLFFLGILTLVAQAQSDLTFYHMGSITPQSSLNNASFSPDANFYFSLPGLSGMKLNASLGFRYSDLMVPVEGSDSVKVDLERVLSNLNEGDNLSFRGDISIFQIGLNKAGRSFNLFSNVRYSGGLDYPVHFLNYFIHGNGTYIGRQVEEKNLAGGGIMYHEIGLGYAQDLTVMLDKKMRIGGRIKYLTGIAQMSSTKNASMTLLTDPDSYDISARFNNATYRTAGFNELKSDSFAKYALGFGSNSNKGFAVDLGAELEINEKLTTSLAINDIGFINWKQDVEEYTFTETSIALDGFENLDEINLSEALEDSLDVWTESSEGGNSYRTSVGSRIIAGASYQALPNGVVSGSIYRNGTSYHQTEYGFGVGYTHNVGKTLTLSTTILKEQFRPVEAGVGFVVRASIFQFYGVFDDAFNLFKDPTNIQGTSFRFGLNFLIGRNNQVIKVKEQKEELSPFPPEYDLDHLLDDN